MHSCNLAFDQEKQRKPCFYHHLFLNGTLHLHRPVGPWVDSSQLWEPQPLGWHCTLSGVGPTSKHKLHETISSYASLQMYIYQTLPVSIETGCRDL